MAPKFDVYSHVTDTIIAEIEAGTPPVPKWRSPPTAPIHAYHTAFRRLLLSQLWPWRVCAFRRDAANFGKVN